MTHYDASLGKPVGGVNTQPHENVRPGQFKECVNLIPTESLTLDSRPSSEVTREVWGGVEFLDGRFHVFKSGGNWFLVAWVSDQEAVADAPAKWMIFDLENTKTVPLQLSSVLGLETEDFSPRFASVDDSLIIYDDGSAAGPPVLEAGSGPDETRYGVFTMECVGPWSNATQADFSIDSYRFTFTTLNASTTSTAPQNTQPAYLADGRRLSEWIHGGLTITTSETESDIDDDFDASGSFRFYNNNPSGLSWPVYRDSTAQGHGDLSISLRDNFVVAYSANFDYAIAVASREIPFTTSGSGIVITSQSVEAVEDLPTIGIQDWVLRVESPDSESDAPTSYFRSEMAYTQEFNGIATSVGKIKWAESTFPGPSPEINNKPKVFTFTGFDGNTSYPSIFYTLEDLDLVPPAVGDIIGNPVPPFMSTTGTSLGFNGEDALDYAQVGLPITDIGVYQDRMYVIAGDTISFSRVGDYTNFFRKSMLFTSDDDPFVLRVGRTDGEYLYAATTHDKDLFISGINQYYISGDEPLTPNSASLVPVARLSAQPVAPVSTGTGLLVPTFSGTDSSVREVLLGRDAGTRVFPELASEIPGYIGKSVLSTAANAGISIAAFVSTNSDGSGDNELIIYKWLDTSQSGRVISAWQKMDMQGQPLAVFFADNTLVVVVMNSTSNTERDQEWFHDTTGSATDRNYWITALSVDFSDTAGDRSLDWHQLLDDRIQSLTQSAYDEGGTQIDQVNWFHWEPPEYHLPDRKFELYDRSTGVFHPVDPNEIQKTWVPLPTLPIYRRLALSRTYIESLGVTFGNADLYVYSPVKTSLTLPEPVVRDRDGNPRELDRLSFNRLFVNMERSADLGLTINDDRGYRSESSRSYSKDQISAKEPGDEGFLRVPIKKLADTTAVTLSSDGEDPLSYRDFEVSLTYRPRRRRM